MLAGTQSGKTAWGPWWLAREIRRRGTGDYLAVTASYDLFKLKMLPAILHVFVDILGIGRYWSGDRIIEIRPDADPAKSFPAERADGEMWARIILRSAESGGGLEASTAKAAWCDEAGQQSFGLNDWTAVKRRLAIHNGRALVSTTLYDLGWVKQEFIDPFAEQQPDRYHLSPTGAEARYYENDSTALIQFDSILNPAYPMADYQDAQAKLPADEFSMFWRGMATKLRTLIYDVFDPKRHCVEPFEIPDEWPRFVGVDPLGHRVAAVWLAFDPVGEKLYLYREYSGLFGKTTAGHVRDILGLCAGERIWGWAGGAPSERQPRADWTGYGIDLQLPSSNPALAGDVWSQIMRVYATFASDQLLIFNHCANIKAELGSYQRRKDAQGNPTNDILEKSRFDGCDCLRYIITWLSDPGEQRRVLYLPNIINPRI